ncbi:histidine phosphatase family protein [Tabrizicola sp.]|uniref:histidine phosphatase family protein n=1 Tax=Tabrizicola sp. TaxID=2005166 RepID=UPI0026133F78|nr:histidine phosphatase family protein [Tabrizicola sp.]MDM7933117.1 histidine phosphatase family protein [Tabrizicola sp.]
MTRLWWVRHGPTHEKAMTGWRDVPADLSDTAAIARLDAHLPRAAIVTSSDLLRATATAEVLAQGRSRLSPDSSLREIHFGDWDGRHWSDIATTDPDLSRLFWEQPGSHRAPNGESWDDAAARASTATDRLVARHHGQDLIIVAHFGIILTQLARATGQTPHQVLAQTIDPLSVTCLAHDAGQWQALSINHRP